MHRQVSNIRRILVGNQIVGHSDVVGESPVGAAPTTSSFSTEHLASTHWTKTTTSRDEKRIKFWDVARLILETLRYVLVSKWCLDLGSPWEVDIQTSGGIYRENDDGICQFFLNVWLGRAIYCWWKVPIFTHHLPSAKGCCCDQHHPPIRLSGDDNSM